ncbi:mucin-19-like [Ornithodoros turicata]|uniref:mucin-19-like n=1 Tax=Ornithodoros turicata TaxID=34597 RepID=UPI0031389FC6
MSLEGGKIPAMSVAKWFKYPPKPDHLPPMDRIAEGLITPRLPFVQIRKLKHECNYAIFHSERDAIPSAGSREFDASRLLSGPYLSGWIHQSQRDAIPSAGSREFDASRLLSGPYLSGWIHQSERDAIPSAGSREFEASRLPSGTCLRGWIPQSSIANATPSLVQAPGSSTPPGSSLGPVGVLDPPKFHSERDAIPSAGSREFEASRLPLGPVCVAGSPKVKILTMDLPSSIVNATPSLVQAPGSSKPPDSCLGPVCVAGSTKVQAPGSSTPPGSSLGPVGVAGSTRENATPSLVQAPGSSKPPDSPLGPVCVAGSPKGELLRLHELDLFLTVNATPSLVQAPGSSTPPGSSLGPVGVAGSTRENATPSLVQAPGSSTPPGSSLGLLAWLIHQRLQGVRSLQTPLWDLFAWLDPPKFHSERDAIPSAGSREFDSSRLLSGSCWRGWIHQSSIENATPSLVQAPGSSKPPDSCLGPVCVAGSPKVHSERDAIPSAGSREFEASRLPSGTCLRGWIPQSSIVNATPSLVQAPGSSTPPGSSLGPVGVAGSTRENATPSLVQAPGSSKPPDSCLGPVCVARSPKVNATLSLVQARGSSKPPGSSLGPVGVARSTRANATPSLVQAPGSSTPRDSSLGPICVADPPEFHRERDAIPSAGSREFEASRLLSGTCLRGWIPQSFIVNATLSLVQAPGSSTPPGSSLGPVGVAGSTRENATPSLVQSPGSSKPPGSPLGPVCVAGSPKGELLRLHDSIVNATPSLVQAPGSSTPPGSSLGPVGAAESTRVQAPGSSKPPGSPLGLFAWLDPPKFHRERDAIPSAGSREFEASRLLSGTCLRGWIPQSFIVNATLSLVQAPGSSTPPGSSLGPVGVAGSTRENATPSLVQAPGSSKPPDSPLGPVCVAGSPKGELLRLHDSIVNATPSLVQAPGSSTPPGSSLGPVGVAESTRERDAIPSAGSREFEASRLPSGTCLRGWIPQSSIVNATPSLVQAPGSSTPPGSSLGPVGVAGSTREFNHASPSSIENATPSLVQAPGSSTPPGSSLGPVGVAGSPKGSREFDSSRLLSGSCWRGWIHQSSIVNATPSLVQAPGSSTPPGSSLGPVGVAGSTRVHSERDAIPSAGSREFDSSRLLSGSCWRGWIHQSSIENATPSLVQAPGSSKPPGSCLGPVCVAGSPKGSREFDSSRLLSGSCWRGWIHQSSIVNATPSLVQAPGSSTPPGSSLGPVGVAESTRERDAIPSAGSREFEASRLPSGTCLRGWIPQSSIVNATPSLVQAPGSSTPPGSSLGPVGVAGSTRGSREFDSSRLLSGSCWRGWIHQSSIVNATPSLVQAPGSSTPPGSSLGPVGVAGSTRASFMKLSQSVNFVWSKFNHASPSSIVNATPSLVQAPGSSTPPGSSLGPVGVAGSTRENATPSLVQAPGSSKPPDSPLGPVCVAGSPKVPYRTRQPSLVQAPGSSKPPGSPLGPVCVAGSPKVKILTMDLPSSIVNATPSLVQAPGSSTPPGSSLGPVGVAGSTRENATPSLVQAPGSSTPPGSSLGPVGVAGSTRGSREFDSSRLLSGSCWRGWIHQSSIVNATPSLVQAPESSTPPGSSLGPVGVAGSTRENATPSLVQAPGSSKPPGSPLGPVCVAGSPKVQAPGSSTPPGSSLGPVGVAGSTRENATPSLVQAPGSSKPPDSLWDLFAWLDPPKFHRERDAIPSAGSREFEASRLLSGTCLRGWIPQSFIVNATLSLVQAPGSSTPPGSSLGPVGVAGSTRGSREFDASRLLSGPYLRGWIHQSSIENATPSLVQAPGSSKPPDSPLGPVCVAGSPKGLPAEDVRNFSARSPHVRRLRRTVVTCVRDIWTSFTGTS